MQKILRAATLALGTCALAGFSPSSSAAWTFTADNGGDGSIAGTYPQFILTGSNNGDPSTKGFESTTSYTQSFANAETISFTWQYASLDSSGLGTYDPAGWLVIDNGTVVSTQLSIDAGTTSSGTATVSVAAGDTFGFYVYSADSLAGPGVLAINEALPPPPPPPPAIPEPQNAALMLAGLAALFAAVRAGATRRG